MADVRFTVFTPAYNRRHTIHRVFESLMRQTCMDFEWLVIDDGSTDQLEPLIAEYAAKAPFKVRYYYKENGGKHTATNMAYKLMETEYFTVLDSDDAFVDTAVEEMLAVWDSIPDSKKDLYWCVVGHCIDVSTQKLIGEYFPEDANERPEGVKTVGDKTAALRTDIVSRYPYPEPKGTTFITESVAYNKIEKDYRQYYVNTVWKKVYLNEPDSLTLAWYRDHVQEGYLSNFVWKQSTLNDVGMKGIRDVYALFQYVFYGVMSNRSTGEIVKGLNKFSYRLLSATALLPAKVLRSVRRMRGTDLTQG